MNTHLTVKQVATILNIHKNSVYRHCEHPTNPIPHIRFGNTIRIPPAGLQWWIRKNTTGAPNP